MVLMMKHSSIIEEDLDQICSSSIAWENLRGCRVLITGATGMIASYLTMSLLHYRAMHQECSFELSILVRSLKKAQDMFMPYWDYDWFHVIAGDVCSWSTKEKFDFIIHGASPADPRSFGIDPAGAFLPNVLGTWSLLELAKRSNAKRFIFLSSGESQGQLLDSQYLIDEHTFGILDPMAIRSCYGEGKRAGEALCAIWNRQYGVPTSVIRISHTYGPTMDIKHDSRVFAEFVSCIVERKDISLKSDGSAIRPFCYVSDAVDGILRVLLAPNPELCYLMAGKEYLSIWGLAHMLCRLFPERQLHVIKSIRSQNDSYLEASKQPQCKIDTSKLQALGWKPEVTVEEGFVRTVHAIEENWGR